MSPVSAADQVRQLTDQLLQSYVRRDKAAADLKTAEDQILAVRNILAGVNLGKEVAAPADAAPTNPEE